MFHITDAGVPVEDLLVDNDILDKQLAKLGRIDVSICRSYISKPRGNHSRKSDRLNKETRHIHKRLLTQSLSHTFKWVFQLNVASRWDKADNTRAGTEWKRLQPGYTKKTRAIPIDGRHGQPIKFRFLYRSSGPYDLPLLAGFHVDVHSCTGIARMRSCEPTAGSIIRTNPNRNDDES